MTGQLGAVNLNERIASIKKSLAKHPKINIVATEGTEEDLVKEFGSKKGTVKVFAFDDLPDTVKGVKQGDIQGIMVQRPVTMGKMLVEHLVNQINGKETAPKDLDTGVNVVTSQNLTPYTK